VIVITPSCGLKGRREGGGDPCRRHEYKLHTNGDAGQGGRGSSTESMEGTRARRAVPSRATERRAWGGAVDPRGRSTHGRSCSRAGDEVTAQRRTFEVDAVCTVDDAIEDGVAEGRIADHLMPAIHGDLAGDQQ
jgi:hypothetical protein